MLKNAASSNDESERSAHLISACDSSQRQHGRDGGYEDDSGRGENPLGQQREAGGAVEEDDVVVPAECVEKSRHHAFRLPEVVEQPIELAIREVRRQQVEVAVVRLLDGRAERLAAFEALPAEALDARADAKSEARRGLRVEVPEQRPLRRPPRRDTTDSPPSSSFRRRLSCCRSRSPSSCSLRRSRVPERAPARRSRRAARGSAPASR